MHGYQVTRLFDVLIMADDFTGACDTGAQFASTGGPCRVVIEDADAPVSGDDAHALRHECPGASVCVVDTETRHASAAQAAAIVRRVSSAAATDGSGWSGLVYKKIDSTLRGNIAAEIEALARVFPERLLVVAPAFPATGRTTRGGLCLVNGRPVDETEFARDVRVPVRSARIADLLGFAHSRHCGPAELAGIFRGARRGAAFVVDAESDADLDRVASLVAGEPARYIAVGSAGLAAALARLSGHADAGPQQPPAPVAGPRGAGAPPVLGLVGSLSERSRRQAEVLRGRGGVTAVTLADAGRAIEVLAGGGQALVMTSPPLGGEAPLRFARALGAVARRAVEEAAGLRLFLTGGDTALAAVRALGACAVDVHRQIVPGVPAITIPALLAGRRLTVTAVTKAGGFGDDETMVTAFRRLREERCWR